MDDFDDRSINELFESYPLFLEALKAEYDTFSTITDIIFSSCSIITKTEKIDLTKRVIECEAFDCFFEYQIHKIMEKYAYYNKIQTQLYIIEHINSHKLFGYLGLKSVIDRNFYIPANYKRLFVYYNTDDDAIFIYFELTHYRIKVEDKYQQDMLN